MSIFARTEDCVFYESNVIFRLLFFWAWPRSMNFLLILERVFSEMLVLKEDSGNIYLQQVKILLIGEPYMTF